MLCCVLSASSRGFPYVLSLILSEISMIVMALAGKTDGR
jgi:hypothetical protein